MRPRIFSDDMIIAEAVKHLKPEEIDDDDICNLPDFSSINHLEKNKFGDRNLVLKDYGAPISIKMLNTMFKPIKWWVSHRGCEHYCLGTHKGWLTDIEARKEKDDVCLNIDDSENIFGGRSSCTGSMYIRLKSCRIQLREMCGWLSIDIDTKCDGLGIYFHNQDKAWKPSEKFKKDLPREFMVRLHCGDCGRIMRESIPLSALDIDIKCPSFSFGGALFLGNCPDCGGNSGFATGSVNLHTNEVYYRVKSNRKVDESRIEQIAKPQYNKYQELIYPEREEEYRKKKEREAAEAKEKEKEKEKVGV